MLEQVQYDRFGVRQRGKEKAKSEGEEKKKMGEEKGQIEKKKNHRPK